MNLSKRLRVFLLCVFILVLLLNIFEVINLSLLTNFFVGKVWYRFLLFSRAYVFNEVDYALDDRKAKYVLYECLDFCGGWADRLKGNNKEYITLLK